MAARFEQRNPYKGQPPRPWVRLRFRAKDGSMVEVELLADTGNPCAVITRICQQLHFYHRAVF